MTLYSFLWNDVFNGYLEIIKPPYKEAADVATKVASIDLFEKVSIMLHPFMPFITEEVWHKLRDRKEGEDCIVAAYPSISPKTETVLLSQMELSNSIITSVRDLRNKHQLSPKKAIKLSAIDNDEIAACFAQPGMEAIIKKMANLEEITQLSTEEGVEGNSFICGKTKLFAHLDLEINVEEELPKLTEELKRQHGFKAGVEKKLSNERFVAGAPPAVVEKEKKKLSDAIARIAALEEDIKRLGGKA